MPPANTSLNPVRILGLSLLLVVQAVTHLAWLPISAHSGQVAIPWMMRQGMTLFDTLIEQHAPGSSLLAALAQALLPVAPVQAIQFANLALVLLTTALVYALAARLSAHPLAGIAAALVWFWWEPVYSNVMFYFDTLLGFALILAALVALWLDRRGWLMPLLAGLLLGAATIAKQHGWGAVMLIGGWLMVFRGGQRLRDLSVYALGVLIAPALLLIVMAAQGTLDSYLYWNWGFNFSGLMENDPLSGDFLRKLLFTNALVPVFLLTLRRSPQAWLIALLWLGGSATLIPRPGEVHAMGQLPLVAVMSGVVIVEIVAYLRRVGADSVARSALAGLLLFVLAGWGWTGAAAYARTFHGIPAHDEFTPITDHLRQISQPGDTLFILPQTDSTPQLHPMSELLPPGTWIKGWFWYLEVPGVVDDLLAEWADNPPTYIIYFPDLIDVGAPGIAPLVDFMQAHYEPAADFPAITFHGTAVIYRYAVGAT